MRKPNDAHRAWVVALLVLAATALAPVRSAMAQSESDGATPPAPVTITFYSGIDCQHCADERPFLAGLQSKYPGLVIDELEVWRNADNRAQLKEHAAALGFTPAGTPVTIIGDLYWVGFTSAIAKEIEAAVDAASSGQELRRADQAVVDVPIFGEIDVAESSLVVSALIIGFIDGVNPCSLWVLSVLLAIVLHSGSRGRVLIVGSTFLFVTTLMYGLYMTGMYSVLDYVGELTWIRSGVALVALVFGLIHIKDFFWFKKGVSLSIDDAKKPGLYKRMRALADLDRSLPAVLGGTVALAVGVSLLETPCTAGLPLLWTNLLASQGVSFGTAVGLFAVYMAVFLLDELAIFGVAVVTLRSTKVQEHHGRALKLVSGTVMVALALAMVLFPSALESVMGTVKVFGYALVVAAAVWAATWLVASARGR
jgi:cytochrome c biogenesis protein CcdA